jgi:hypothetical protein
MPHRQEDFVLSDQTAVAVRVYASGIRDVIPVGLEEPNYRVFMDEKIKVVLRRVDWPVVTDFESAADWVSLIKTVPAVVVVGLPGSVGGLLQNVGMAGIIAHDEN